MQKHHVIPVSLLGENISENKIHLEETAHANLHKSQDIPYKAIRRFREKTNGIIMPNDYFFDQKHILWDRYFINPIIHADEQLHSLNRQIQLHDNYEAIDFNDAISTLIELQRQIINDIIKKS